MEMVSNIVNIWSIPLVGDKICCICGRLSQLFGIFICKDRENMVFRLGNCRNEVHYAKICCPHPCVSCLVVDLGARTKCGHFSKLYANNYVWKNVKIK